MNKKAFSFIEMIIVISIVILVWVIASTVGSNQSNKARNARISADIETMANAFASFALEQNTLPEPSWNTNWFGDDGSYKEANQSDAFGVYGQVTQATLPKKYLDILPLDPFTWAYYAYGRMRSDTQYELAAILRNNQQAQAIVAGNYRAENWPFNLIREYNWPEFVFDGSAKYFPYNPDELAMNARITQLDFSGYEVGHIFEQWDQVTVPAGASMTLYLADGSKLILGGSEATSLTLTQMQFVEDNSLFTNVQIALNSWVVWVNAATQWTQSTLSIQAWDTTAAVRGTIFWMNSNWVVEVVSGAVQVSSSTGQQKLITPLSPSNGSVEAPFENAKKGAGLISSALKHR